MSRPWYQVAATIVLVALSAFILAGEILAAYKYSGELVTRRVALIGTVLILGATLIFYLIARTYHVTWVVHGHNVQVTGLRFRWFASAFGLVALLWLPQAFPVSHISTSETLSKPHASTTSSAGVLTLSDLFERDFAGSQKVCRTLNVTRNSDGHQMHLKTCLVIDLERQIKFLEYYIPRSPDTVELANYIVAEARDEVRAQSSVVSMQQRRPGQSDVADSRRFTFTGAVFVYVESELGIEEMGVLTRAFRKTGLQVQFRGSEYLTAAKLRLALENTGTNPE